MKPIFVTDIDGILLNTGKIFAQKWTELLDKPIHTTDLTCWKFEWSLGIGRDLVDRFWNEVWDIPIEPYPGAAWFVDRLRYWGYTVVGLTARMNTDSARTNLRNGLMALAEPGLVGLSDVIICENSSKPVQVDLLNATYFLEDNIDNAVSAKLNCPKLKQVFLFDRPWNRNCLDLSGYKRVYRYGDVFSTLYDS